MTFVSSDPHALLRPLYRQLADDRAFSLLSTETQFQRLVDAVAQQSEHRAALMREYTPAARAALLGHLRKAEEQRPGAREVELWAARKASRTLCCVATYLATGVDVRLLEDGDMRRTQLVGDGSKAEALAAEWKAAATGLGWV